MEIEKGIGMIEMLLKEYIGPALKEETTSLEQILIKASSTGHVLERIAEVARRGNAREAGMASAIQSLGGIYTDLANEAKGILQPLLGMKRKKIAEINGLLERLKAIR